ncbi:hypothetical protein A9X06_04985 [Mycobacterium sp. 852002-51759_SCH5129042]|nr:hypothetical protein A9X06_04985 [Mycobacterium sp. 852002-51759_SCH5129042]
MTTTLLSSQLNSSEHCWPEPGAAPTLPTGETYTDFKHRYEELFGLVRHNPTSNALTVRAHHFIALMLLPGLADAVFQALPSRPLPNFEVRHGVRVLLATAPNPDELSRGRSVLFDARVAVVDRGAELTLPTPGNGLRRWPNGLPTDTWLPSYRDVIDAIHDATASTIATRAP